MRKLTTIICITIAVLFEGVGVSSSADQGYIVKEFPGCDYFIADGPNGLYVLEWYGGYYPSEGDTITGDINSYGMKNVTYNSSLSGRVWVEDFMETPTQAMEEIKDHC